MLEKIPVNQAVTLKSELLKSRNASQHRTLQPLIPPLKKDDSNEYLKMSVPEKVQNYQNSFLLRNNTERILKTMEKIKKNTKIKLEPPKPIGSRNRAQISTPQPEPTLTQPSLGQDECQEEL